jgi:hypothetical protein
MTTNTERLKLLHADFKITQAFVGHSFKTIGLRRTPHITLEMVGYACTTLGLSVDFVKTIKAIHPLLRFKHVVVPEMVGCKWSEIGLSRNRIVIQSMVGLSLKELGLRPAVKAPIL